MAVGGHSGYLVTCIRDTVAAWRISSMKVGNRRRGLVGGGISAGGELGGQTNGKCVVAAYAYTFGKWRHWGGQLSRFVPRLPLLLLAQLHGGDDGMLGAGWQAHYHPR